MEVYWCVHSTILPLWLARQPSSPTPPPPPPHSTLATVTCHLQQKTGAGMQSATCCYWDKEKDGAPISRGCLWAALRAASGLALC